MVWSITSALTNLATRLRQFSVHRGKLLMEETYYLMQAVYQKNGNLYFRTSILKAKAFEESKQYMFFFPPRNVPFPTNGGMFISLFLLAEQLQKLHRQSSHG